MTNVLRNLQAEIKSTPVCFNQGRDLTGVIDEENLIHIRYKIERLLLTQEGHEVLIANEARSAIDLLILFPMDLVIVDIMMPELSGFNSST